MAAPIGALPSPRISPAACRPSTASSARAVGPACVSQKKTKNKNDNKCSTLLERLGSISRRQLDTSCFWMWLDDGDLSTRLLARTVITIIVIVISETTAVSVCVYLMRGPDSNFSLCGSQPAGFRIVSQDVKERVLGRSKVLGCLNVSKVLNAAHTPTRQKKKRKRKQMIYRPQLVLLVFARHPAKLTTCESSRPKQMPRIKQERSVL